MLGTKKLINHPNSAKPVGVLCQTTFLKTSSVIGLMRLFNADAKYLNPKQTTLGGYIIGKENHSDIKLNKLQASCLFYLLRGKTIKEIAHLLCRSPRTIKKYVENLKRLFGCPNKSALIEKAINLGFLFQLPKF